MRFKLRGSGLNVLNHILLAPRRKSGTSSIRFAKNKQTDFQVFNNGVMAWQSNPWGNLKATHTTDQVVASDELHQGVLQGKS